MPKTKKKSAKPKLILLTVLKPNGGYGATLSIDAGLLRKQAKTLGNILDANHGFVNVYEFTDAELESVQGVWEMMHSILDGIES